MTMEQARKRTVLGKKYGRKGVAHWYIIKGRRPSRDLIRTAVTEKEYELKIAEDELALDWEPLSWITQTLRNIEGRDCIEYDCTACESTMGYVIEVVNRSPERKAQVDEWLKRHNHEGQVR